MVLLLALFLMFDGLFTLSADAAAEDTEEAITGLPAPWKGTCKREGRAPNCAVHRMGPGPTQLLIVSWLNGGYSIGFNLPDEKASAVRVTPNTRTSPPVSRLIPMMIRGMEAFAFEMELIDSAHLFIELDFPRHQVVAMPLDGLRRAIDILHQAAETRRTPPTQTKRKDTRR